MQSDPSRHHAQVVRKIYEQCINQGDVTSLSELVHESFEGAQGERGPAGFGETIRALRSAFPNIHFTIEDLIADGDSVAVRWRWEGTHEGGFRGIPATGRRIATTGIAIYAFERGAVRRAWLESDRLGVLQKMGVVAAIPTAAGAAPPP